MNDLDNVLLETADARVRILVLEGNQATAWHFHTEVTDKMLCLDGEIAVEYQKPQERVTLDVGERCEVSVNRIHRVVNLSSEPSRYLLVQGVGRYDFNVVDERTLTGQ